MAQTKTASVTKKHVNNSTAYTVVSYTAEAVVVNNQLVPDIKEEDPGVIIDRRP